MKSSALNIKLSLFGGLGTNPGSYAYSVSVLPRELSPKSREEDGGWEREEEREEEGEGWERGRSILTIRFKKQSLTSGLLLACLSVCLTILSKPTHHPPASAFVTGATSWPWEVGFSPT